MRTFVTLLGVLLVLGVAGCSSAKTTDFDELNDEEQRKAIEGFRDTWIESYTLLGFTDAEADCTWDLIEDDALASIDEILADEDGFAFQWGVEIGEKYSDEIIDCIASP